MGFFNVLSIYVYIYICIVFLVFRGYVLKNMVFFTPPDEEKKKLESTIVFTHTCSKLKLEK